MRLCSGPGRLALGDVVEAKVEEVSLDLSLIVNFDGRLCRVINESLQAVKKGDAICLKLTSISPLIFRFVGSGIV